MVDGDEDGPVVVPISAVFDLHAFAPRDVKSATEAYLEAAHEAGLLAVRIIHGRGIGIQRDRVRQVLSQTSFVIDFADSPAEAGGWGATTATLRQLTVT